MMQRWVLSVFLLGLITFSLGAQGQRLQFRTPNDAVRYYEELMGQVVQQVRSMQDDNARLSGQILELQNRIGTLEQKLQNSQTEFSSLRKQMDADKAARSKDFAKLADKVQKAASSSSTPAAAASAGAAAPAAKAAQGASSDSGDYDIYEVKPGATLYVISRATGVSVQAIRKANNLKNDVIHPGDKLKIPASR